MKRKAVTAWRLVMLAILVLTMGVADGPVVAQSVGCDPSLSAGCPIQLGHGRESFTLANGTDLHTWLISMPEPGVIAVALNAQITSDTDLDSYLVDPSGQLVASAERDLTQWATGSDQERVSGIAPIPGEYRLYVQINPSRDRSVRGLKYSLGVWMLPRVGERLSHDDDAPTSSLAWHAGLASDFAFSTSTQLMATAATDNTFGIWTVPEGRLMQRIGAVGDLRSAVILPGDQRVVGATRYLGVNRHSMINVYEIGSGELISTLMTDVTTNRLIVSPDDRYLVSAQDAGRTVVWDTASLSIVRDLRGHKDGVAAAAFTPSSAELVTGSRDGFAHIWNVESGQIRASLRPGGWINDIAISPDGQSLLLADSNGKVTQWSLADASLVRTIWQGPRGAEAPFSVSVSSDGTLVAAGSRIGAKVWKLSDGELVCELAQGTWMSPVRFLPGTNRLVASHDDGRIRIWTVLNQ